jgi:hypothetical protein
MQRLYGKRLELMKAYMNFSETFSRTDELSKRALRAHNGVQPKGKGKKAYFTFDDKDSWDYDTDREILGTLLRNYRQQVAEKFLPDFYKTIDQKFDGDCQRYADYLYKNSMLMKTGKKIYHNKKSFKKDLGVQFGLDLTTVQADITQGMQELMDSIALQEHYLCAAKLRMEEDQPHYSDANFTMRMSYGQVKEYKIGGWSSGYYTTAESMVDKMKTGDKVEDYKVEPEMKTLLAGPDFGPYADKQTGKMQLCFLTNNDITGGNSGSPMFDGKNRLIGLAFDGNWDSLSSDIFFDSQLARCIGVDIRYVLFMMDKWGHADRLLKEIKSEKPL